MFSLQVLIAYVCIWQTWQMTHSTLTVVRWVMGSGTREPAVHKQCIASYALKNQSVVRKRSRKDDLQRVIFAGCGRRFADVCCFEFFSMPWKTWSSNSQRFRCSQSFSFWGTRPSQKRRQEGWL